MQEHLPTGELKELLDRFRFWGGVVDYVLLETDLELAEEQLHQIAVRFGMMIVQSRLDFEARRCLTMDLSRPRGQVVSVSSFIQEYHHCFCEPPYLLYDQLAQRQLETEEPDRLFSQINLLLFSEFSEWSIRRWSDDWSNYFDDGQEWWGAFYWTIRPAGSQRMVVVGASSTD